MKPEKELDERLMHYLLTMADAGVRNAARGMSSMLGETLHASGLSVRLVDIPDLFALLGGPENEAVGVYLRAERKLSGQILLIIPYANSLEVSDLLLSQPAGTTQALGPIERSALAELGNLTGSFFLNAIADLTGLDSRPSPPAVIVDMVGAIMDILIAAWDGQLGKAPLILAKFIGLDKAPKADFWVLPDRMTLESIARKGLLKNV